MNNTIIPPKSTPPNPQKLKRSIWLRLCLVALILVMLFCFPRTIRGELLIIHMQKPSCFGECPFFTIDIYGSGLMVYKGDLNVDIEGYRIGFISQSTIADIHDAIIQANYFNLEDHYGCGSVGLDAPRAWLEISLGNQSKKTTIVHDCHQEEDPTPPALRDLEHLLDSAANSKEWIREKQ